MGRNLKTENVNRFRGLNCWGNAALTRPDWAIDCMNVLVSSSGALEKLRYPVDLSAATALVGAGNIFNFQNALGQRQLLAMFGEEFYSFELSDYTGTLQNTSVLNQGVMSAVCSNNIAFIANGSRMMKWTGALFQKWGIDKPTAPERTIVTASLVNPAVAPTLSFYTYLPVSIARTYSVTYTYTLGSGETVQSPAAVIALADNQFCTVSVPANPNATGFNVYVDITGGASRHRVNTEDWLGIPNPVSAMAPAEFAEMYPIGWLYHGADPAPPVANTTGNNGIVLAVGRKYRIAYGNSLTGHIGVASEPSLSTGATLITQIITVIAPNPTDTQCDQIWLFSSVDGGEDYYLNPNPNSIDGSWPLAAGATTSIIDRCLDADLNKAIIAPLLNYPPPVGKYVCEWGGRLFVFCLSGAVQDIAFSGYERIYLGRPEESFPPNNRLRLALGADEIRGGGVIQAGVVAFSKSNEMFMLRGTVTDRSTDAPVEYLSELEKLPWQTGCASHFTIARSPHGLAWLASDKTIKIYNGTGEPLMLAGGMLPILRSITPGTEEDARGLYFSFLERDWYLLLCAVDGSTTKNRILVVDLDPDPDMNIGGFPLQISADAMEIVEDANGTSHLVILQEGTFKELKLISDTTNGISLTYAATANTLPARWRSGYFGNQNAEWMKVIRYAKLVTDQLGFQMQAYLVDDEKHTFRDPDIMPFQSIRGKMAINRKTRRASLEIRFPDADTAANVQELEMGIIPTSKR
jgi:hypothetical protein